MKYKFNRFAIFPVMCSDCKRYIWLEPVRVADVFSHIADRYIKKIICRDCIKKYDVGGK